MSVNFTFVYFEVNVFFKNSSTSVDPAKLLGQLKCMWLNWKLKSSISGGRGEGEKTNTYALYTEILKL